MNVFLEKNRQRLLPAMLILFILTAVTFPLATGLTWSGRSESPDRVLTYTEGRLTWDSSAETDEYGAAKLSLFDALSANVASSDGASVVAPGTDGSSIVRLKNSVSGSITYTAVLYRIDSGEELPVEAALDGDGLTDTDSYTLPTGVEESDVIRAVTGTLDGGLLQDFDISWNWLYEYESEELRDEIDTWLGNRAADGDTDEITVGLYIVVEDGNSYVTPTPSTAPKTGDDSALGLYTGLMCFSLFAILFLLLGRRKKEPCEEICKE